MPRIDNELQQPNPTDADQHSYYPHILAHWAMIPLTVQRALDEIALLAAAGHPILDANVHTDSAAQAVTGGSIIVANKTPKWDELTVGAAGEVLWVSIDTPVWHALVEADIGDLGAYVLAHDMLDGTVHLDSVVDGVSRGSLIFGNATPKWDELQVGAVNEYLHTDGTDLAWAALDISHDTTPTLGGDVNGGGNNITNVAVLAVTTAITTPDIGITNDRIADSNGDYVLKFAPAGGTVVNEITVGNSEAGDPVTIAATGTDAVIAISLIPKGATGLAHVRITNEARVYRDANNATTRMYTFSNTITHGSNIQLNRALGTEAVPLAVTDGTLIGSLSSGAYLGGSNRFRGRISFTVAGVPSGTSVPIDIEFQTGAAALSTRLTIQSGGNIRVESTNHLEFNSATAYIYAPSAGNLTIQANTLAWVKGSATVKIEGGSDVQFWEGNVEQVNIQNQNMVFHPAAGADTRFDFGTDGTMMMYVGAAPRFSYNAVGLAFNSALPVAQPTVTGVRNNPEGALADLLTDLATLGLVVDNTTAGTAWTGGVPVAFNSIKAPGTKPATFKEWGITGVWEFSDATDDTVVFMLTPPSNMDRTIAPSMEIRWSTNTAVDTETCVWQLEYLYLQVGEDATAAAQETLTVNSNAVAQADGMVVAEITGMDLLDANDVCICCRLKRLGADGNDDLTDTAELHAIRFKYTLAEGRS